MNPSLRIVVGVTAVITALMVAAYGGYDPLATLVHHQAGMAF
jgi:hypothetical protein